ncbi:MAG TPA: hypothetical protein VEJ88_05780 [Dissulfurispiraceae bacterium]|nr:hypothetical protein [Dissulfurispiraceae bacterium]
MHTLFDFVTHIKGVEYIASLTFIAGFLMLNEVLKPKPFGTMVQTGKEDIKYIKIAGSGQLLISVKRIIAAPFIGLAYVAILPVAFLFALASTAINGVLGFAGREASFGWRPMEAYLSGKKGDKKKKDQTNEKK